MAALGGAEWTDREALPGGNFPKETAGELCAALARDYTFLSEDEVLRLTRGYGTLARTILGVASTREDLGHDFGHGLSEREVAWLIDREWAQTAEDVLWRRTKLGLRFSPRQTAVLEAWMTEQAATPTR